jgi:hypothetical protein
MHLEATVTNKNEVNGKVRGRINSRNSYVLKLLSST